MWAWQSQQGGVRDHSRWVMGGGVSPPAARQSWPPAGWAFSLAPRCFVLGSSLSPAHADAAPHETTPADRETVHASGHANIASTGMAARHDKWDTRKLKGWVTNISAKNWLEVLHSRCKNSPFNQEVSPLSRHVHRHDKIKHIEHVGCHRSSVFVGVMMLQWGAMCLKIILKMLWR